MSLAVTFGLMVAAVLAVRAVARDEKRSAETEDEIGEGIRR